MAGRPSSSAAPLRAAPRPLAGGDRRAPRTKPAALRREDLLRAGESVILAKGVAAASVDEIAASAGVAKGTFYLYFASKEVLVEALRERWIQRMDARIRHFEARVAPGDWCGRLDAYVEGGVRGYLENLAIHDALFHDLLHGPRAEDPIIDNPIVAEVAAFLGEGMRAGAWHLEDPAFTAVMFFHALHGGIDHAIATEPRVQRRRLIARLQAFFRRAVGASVPPSLKRS